MKPAILLASAFLLASCTTASPDSTAPSGSPAPSATAAPTPAPDIIAPELGISLGKGWYPYETFHGEAFRWVDNDAQIIVERPLKSPELLSATAEAGPGLGTVRFVLTIRDAAGHVVQTVPVDGKQRLQIALPVQPGHQATFTLHVAGKGKHIPKDPRILSFRVFEIGPDNPVSNARGGPKLQEITRSPNVRIGRNWYPLEHFKGETFRWIDNDAEFIVSSEAVGQKRLRLDVAAGPSIKSPGDFELALEDPSGTQLQVADVHDRGTTYLNLPLHAGTNAFRLHVASTGQKAPHDPRVLDFRVFSLSVE